MGDFKPSLVTKFCIYFFSISIVALASHQIVGLKHKKDSDAIKAGKEKLLRELQGGVDAGRASISPDYIREVVDTKKLVPDGTNQDSIPLRNSLKERVYDSLHRIWQKADSESEKQKSTTQTKSYGSQ